MISEIEIQWFHRWSNRDQLFIPDGPFWHRPLTTSTKEEHHPKKADKEKAAMLVAAL